MKQINRIKDQCKQLRLPAIADCISAMADKAAAENMSYLEFATILFNDEISAREKRSLDRKIKDAQLPLRHDLKVFNCSLIEGISPVFLAQLKELSWIDQAENLVIMGPPGVGKTLLSGGLCHQAILNGYSAYFRSMDQLMTTVSRKDTNRSAAIEYRRLTKANLIVIESGS